MARQPCRADPPEVPAPTGVPRAPARRGGRQRYARPTARQGARRFQRLLQGRYRVLDAIGNGGMATVYRGRDERSKRIVAIKIIAEHLADLPLFVKRFRHEVELSARLRHPNIVALLDAGDEPRNYMVMEFVDGLDVGRSLPWLRRLTPDHTVHLVVSICEALAYAHEHRVVHGDVSHRNILIRRSDWTAKLADFGLSSGGGDGAARCPPTMIGTPGYVAPEVLWGSRHTPLSDLYSLGMATYRFLAGPPGARPGDADATAPMATALPRLVPLAEVRPDLPHALCSAVHRATARDPHARQDSISQFREQLLGGTDGGAPSMRTGAMLGRESRAWRPRAA